MEGTIEELSAAVGVGEPYKQAGRAPLGGADRAVWEALAEKLAQGVKTKNGLPGIPYAIKEKVQTLKAVWSEFEAGAGTAHSPVGWEWLVTDAELRADRISKHLWPGKENHAPDYLSVLAYVTQSLYPEHAASYTAYNSAYLACTPVPHCLTPAERSHWVSWPDWLRIKDHVDALFAAPDNGPELTRLLGWCRCLFALLCHPSLVQWEAPHGQAYSALDKLTLCLTDEPNSATVFPCLVTRPGTPVRYELYTGFEERVYSLGRETSPFAWARSMRSNMVEGERLLPRRSTADGLLHRLSVGPLATLLRGRILTVRGARLARCSHELKHVMTALDDYLAALGMEGVQHAVPALLAASIRPSSLAAGVQQKLTFPGDLQTAEDYVMHELS